MDRDEVLKKVTEIARDVFENPRLKLKEDTTAIDVDGWDSLTHLAFISDIEDEYGFRFTLSEITDLKNIGQLLNIIIENYK